MHTVHFQSLIFYKKLRNTYLRITKQMITYKQKNYFIC